MYLHVFISGMDVAIKGPPKASVSLSCGTQGSKGQSVGVCLLPIAVIKTLTKSSSQGERFVCFTYPRSQSNEGSHSRKQGQNTGGK